MPTPQLAYNIRNIGGNGLNTQDARSNLTPQWATVADNLVIDNGGRLASRKGWSYSTPVANRIAGTIVQTHTFVTDTGSELISVDDSGSLYSGFSLSDVTGSLTFTNSNFQFANLNNAVMGVELNEAPIYYNKTLASFETALEQISDWQASTAYGIGDVVQPTTANDFYYVATTTGTTAGSEPTWPTTLDSTVVDSGVTWQAKQIPQGDAIFSGYGRMWLSDSTKTVLHYSDLLIPYKFSGGSSGVIDLKSVWVYGMDEIVAINGFNGFLIIFGRNSILIYQNTDDPTNLTLVENIRGIGCVARDSVQHTGEDIIFLSSSGVRSLSRVIQEKSNPIGDETKNVRDFLDTFVLNTADLKTVKSCYSESEALYLLTFPEFDRTFALDTRRRLEDGTRRVTTWVSMGISSLTADIDSNIYIGRDTGIARYTGFLDGTEDIRINYSSGWIKLDNDESQGRLFMMKRLDALILAASNTGVAVKWAWDFSNSVCSETQQTDIITGVSQYGISEYGVDEYGQGEDSFTVRIAPSGYGKSLRIELSAAVPNTDFVIQEVSINLKRGRID